MNFTSPWAAIERAADQCLDVFGLKECSRLLEGSNGLFTDLRASSSASHSISKKVTFTNQIELLYGSEDGVLSSIFMTQDSLREWEEKPWTLHADPLISVVEPLSPVAVLIPTGGMRTDVVFGAPSQSEHAAGFCAQQNASSTTPEAAAAYQPSDLARFDMDQTWLLQLRIAWREFAAEAHQGEGRTLPVVSWYLHHQDETHCRQPRSLELDRMDHLWLADLRELWADHIHDGEALHITYVQPLPPRDDAQPFAPHVILTQGLVPDRIGVVMTVRFIQDHHVHLLQEAVSSPRWMCGRRAVDLLHVNQLIQDRRWVARSGILWFDEHELEEIAEGLSINIDIRVPTPDFDETSFAAWTRGNFPPDQPLFDLPQAVQQHEAFQDDASEADSSPDDASHSGVDWRFTHVYRTRHRVYHGHLPWDNAFEFQGRVSHLTGVAEDDIAYCHHVEHRPSDLEAAHTEVLLMQSVADLAIGSVHRLVLVDIEFHEHWPATDISTSRRCLSLPHLSQRRTLMRLLGLDIYCERQRTKCLMWLNHKLIPVQQYRSFHLEHGDYLRVAIPPLTTAEPKVSTRTCVSMSRQRRHRNRPRAVHLRRQPHHEVGMTDVDELDLGLHDDMTAMIQFDTGVLTTFPQPVNALLASETAELVQATGISSKCNEPMDKLDDDTPERVQEARFQALQADPLQAQLARQPPFVTELFQIVLQRMQPAGLVHENAIFVETWFSDHERRPHSGLGRVVRLEADFRTWYTAIVMAWEDHIDPFHDLACYIANPQPNGGDPDVLLHIVLVQNARPHMVSTLVAVSNPEEDPWHPRLLCLMLTRTHLHHDLLELVDVDRRCGDGIPSILCRIWWHDQEITPTWVTPIPHGATMLFSIQPEGPGIASAPEVEDEDTSSTLQTLTTKRIVQLEHVVAPPADPVWVKVDCAKVLFLRRQLLEWPQVQPTYEWSDVAWRAATLQALQSLKTWTHEHPLGFTFFTDGSASRQSPTATAAAVLIVATVDGDRWGGYVTAGSLGEPTAPRAEATALMLAIRWCCQLQVQQGFSSTWVEFAFDCQTVAGVAQGQLGSQHNSDLLVPVRALLHWLELFNSVPFTWTHLRGHTGHPWNEAADTLCHHARLSGATVADMSMFQQQCGFDDRDFTPVQWLWLLEQSVRGDVTAPPLKDLQWHFNIAQPLSSQPDVTQQPISRRRDVQPDGPRHAKLIKLQFATANVLTLFPGQSYASQYMSARAESLNQQFHDCGFHFVGLQETRSRQEGHIRLPHYHVLSAPTTKRGVGGVQLWIHHKIAFQDIVLQVETHHLHILHATAQRLVVRFQCQGMRLLLVVLHAPVDQDEEHLQSFWRATTHAIPKRYRSWSLFVLADANSRLGSVQSDAVGDWQSEEENIKGQHFHQWLLEHSLFVPQTLSTCHIGPSATWTHATGTTARLDYIACPQELGDAGIETWVEERIDLSLQREDHACVCAQIPVVFHASSPPQRTQRSPLADDFVPPSWNTDVHTHAAALQTWLSQRQHPQVVKRKQHLTSDTFQLIQAKRYHRQSLARLRRHRRHAMLRQIFLSWKEQQAPHDDFGPWLRACDLQEARHLGAFQDLAVRVVAAVRQDDCAFYEELAQHAGSESQKSARHLWQAIRFALPKWRAKQRSNLRCAGPTVPEKAAHYNQLEAGELVPFDLLLRKCWTSQFEAMSEAPLQIPLQELPTRASVEHLCAKQNVAKASGLDTVSPRLVREHGITLAPALTALFLKIWTTGAEPWQWKGGLIHTIGKKHKSPHIEDMRGIALLDVTGKLSHALLRAQMIPALQRVRAPLQLGGFAKQTTTFATHYLRAFEQLASTQRMSSCVIFLDIKSAFHSLVREIIFDINLPLPPRLAEVLHAAGCDPEVVTRRCQSDRFSGHLSPVLVRLLSDAHTHTWYTLASSDEIHHTHRGSRPGSPLADAAYNALMTAVISDLQLALDTHPPLQKAHAQFGLSPSIVAWIDDLALPLVFQSANDVRPVTSDVMHLVEKVCRSFGLSLNMKRGKTEAVVAFRGDTAPAQRRECFGECQGVLCASLPCGVLRCVPRYEHLGTLFTAEGAIEAEVAHRLSKATHAFHQVRRSILTNRHITITTRLKLFEGLIIPVLLHGAGNWPLLSSRTLQKLNGAYFKWIRTIVRNGFWAPDMLSDQHLLMHWRLPSISLRLAKMRLLYAFHLVQDCPSLIVDVVTAASTHALSWIPALRHALSWLAGMDSTISLDDPKHVGVEDIFAWLTTNRVSGPKLVRRLFHRALQQGHMVHRVVQAHWRLQHCFKQSDPVHGRAPGDVLAHECRLCAKQFGTLNQLQVHLWIAHEVLSPERQMMRSTTCDACHRCFWTSQRLQQHLRFSRQRKNGCYEQLTWRRFPAMTAPAIDELPAEARFHRQPVMVVDTAPTQAEVDITSRADADRVLQQCWEAEGLPEEIDLPFRDRMFAEFDAVLHAWQQPSGDMVEQIFFDLVHLADGAQFADDQGVVGEWVFCLWILDFFRCSRFPGLKAEGFQRLDSALQQFLVDSHIGRLVSWQRRMDLAYQPLEFDSPQMPLHKALEPIVDPCNMQIHFLANVFEGDLMFPPSGKVPLCRVNDRTVIVILHLFSGRHRIGDCHWWVRAIADKILPEYPVLLISVDTAIDTTFGDLSNGSNYELILGMARKGAVAGSLTGPPCETFSAARNLQLDHQRGPRPLRTALTPWCLQERTCRELQQCDTGTELLMNSLLLETTIVCEGGGTIMEHPAEPNDEDKVSVWRLVCHEQWCMKLPQACQHRIEQWLFGARGIKPTNLRAINLGEPCIVGRVLLSGAEMWRVKPSQGLKGKDAAGQYRTAQAREYPSALCRSMVVAILSGLRERIHKDGVRDAALLSDSETRWLEHMRRQSEVLARSSFLPDYQRA